VGRIAAACAQQQQQQHQDNSLFTTASHSATGSRLQPCSKAAPLPLTVRSRYHSWQPAGKPWCQPALCLTLYRHHALPQHQNPRTVASLPAGTPPGPSDGQNPKHSNPHALPSAGNAQARFTAPQHNNLSVMQCKHPARSLGRSKPSTPQNPRLTFCRHCVRMSWNVSLH
jgi:hypothetical protein